MPTKTADPRIGAGVLTRSRYRSVQTAPSSGIGARTRTNAIDSSQRNLTGGAGDNGGAGN